MKKATAVILLSGGLDSTTCLFWARRKGYRPVALSVRYGQRHDREILAARAVAKKAGAPLQEVSFSLPWLAVSSLTNRRMKIPETAPSKIGRGAIPSTYVPGRNTLFLALAASLADSVGAGAIVIGANALDYSGYPDCRPAFLGAFSKAAKLGTKRGTEKKPLRILAPLLHLDKKGIVRLAEKVGAPLSLTWSCYAGGSRPCGRCDSCRLREKGFREAGVEDPAL